MFERIVDFCRSWHGFVCSVCVGFLVLPIATVSAVEDGFTVLFDGKTLTNWSIVDGGENAFQVVDGVIHCPGKAHYPCWLKSDKTYENFDLRYEYRYKGWCNSGIFFSAPKYGRKSKVGFEIQIDQLNPDQIPVAMSGAIFESVPPPKYPDRLNGEWNEGRILFNWPNLKVWINGELIHDLNVEENEDLKYRWRHGYIGLQDMGYQCWYRNIRIKELPSKEKWTVLFDGTSMDGWHVEDDPTRDDLGRWEFADGVIRGLDGTTYMVTDGEWKDFELQCYVRTKKNANGGIFIRWKQLPRDRGNEIQIENIPDSNNPTGSVYGLVRAVQAPFIEDKTWFPMQIIVKDKTVIVRVNGETVARYDDLQIVREGHIALQMHSTGSWIEWKDIRIKEL